MTTNSYHLIPDPAAVVVSKSTSQSEESNSLMSKRKMSEAETPFRSMKREDNIDWEDYFMATACLAARRSKDPVRQVGACIVNEDNKIVGVGYNGFPKGCSDDEYPWSKGSPDPLKNKYLYVCHAEVNAILNKNASDTKGCRIYVTLFPCNDCAKFIIQSGIKEVIYMSVKSFHQAETIAAMRMFKDAGVEYRECSPKTKRIIIDFDDVKRNAKS